MKEIGNYLRLTIVGSIIKIEFVLSQLCMEDNIFIIILFLFNLLTYLTIVLFHYIALCFQISRCFMTIDSVGFVEMFSNHQLNQYKHILLLKLYTFSYWDFIFLIIVLLGTSITINNDPINYLGFIFLRANSLI